MSVSAMDREYTGDLALVAIADEAGKTYAELESALSLRGNAEMDDEAYEIQVNPDLILWRESTSA